MAFTIAQITFNTEGVQSDTKHLGINTPDIGGASLLVYKWKNPPINEFAGPYEVPVTPTVGIVWSTSAEAYVTRPQQTRPNFSYDYSVSRVDNDDTLTILHPGWYL